MLSKHDFVLSCMKSTFSHLFLSLFKDCFDILQRVVPNKIRCSFASHFFRENRQDIFTWKDVCSVCRWRCFRLLSAPTAFVVSGQSQTMLFEKNRPKLTKSYRWLHKDFFCVSQVLLRSNLETADFRKETFCEILKTENIEKKFFFLQHIRRKWRSIPLDFRADLILKLAEMTEIDRISLVLLSIHIN